MAAELPDLSDTDACIHWLQETMRTALLELLEVPCVVNMAPLTEQEKAERWLKLDIRAPVDGTLPEELRPSSTEPRDD
jgi:hypothetical protein